MCNNAIIFWNELYSSDGNVIHFMRKRQQSSTVILTNRLSPSLSKNNIHYCSVANEESTKLIARYVQLQRRGSIEFLM